MAWQALDWAFRLAAIYFAFRAFGMPSDLHSVFVVQVAQTLSTLLPLTPAGIGTEQALLVYMFAGTAPASDVLSFSVGLKIVVITVNLTLGTIATLATLRKFPWHVDVDKLPSGLSARSHSLSSGDSSWGSTERLPGGLRK